MVITVIFKMLNISPMKIIESKNIDIGSVDTAIDSIPAETPFTL
ncbi:MAG: hypothetical protein QXS52_01355 [Thermoplasmata archaeon]